MALKPIHKSLSCATCALLGLAQASRSSAAEPWEINLGVMNYIEQDRNTGIEFLLDAKRILGDGDEIKLGVEVDTLTGATPNGASASNAVQTFTQSSGEGSYQVAADELPVDDTHMDTRLAIQAGYRSQHSDDLAIDYSGRLSMEFDYLSFGAGNSYEWDFNQRNTSLTLGFNAEYNRVHPVGNVPDALSPMTAAGTLQNRNTASESRTTAEIGLGITQVINRKSLFQLRYTQSRFSGYLTDPYKIVSIIDDQNPGSLGTTLFYRFESRPDSRDINTLYFAYKYKLSSGVLDLALRHSRDDWNMDASAIELGYRHELANKNYIRPNIRIYHQNAADFYRHSLPASETLPSHLSADTRLASFDATTIGLRYASTDVAQGKHSISAEYYLQKGESHPADAIGLQAQQDLFPDLKTLIIKYLYSFHW